MAKSNIKNIEKFIRFIDNDYLGLIIQKMIFKNVKSTDIDLEIQFVDPDTGKEKINGSYQKGEIIILIQDTLMVIILKICY